MVLREDVEILKKRPTAAGGNENSLDINYDLLCSKEEFMDLYERVQSVEKRNLEQDERLTNNELRIEKLEKAISDPMDRILALESRMEAFY